MGALSWADDVVPAARKVKRQIRLFPAKVGRAFSLWLLPGTILPWIWGAVVLAYGYQRFVA